ncbi:MAG: hypothetical protein O2913_04670 [Chloroflexi bacterium]|nr:hypothetical protein [Chloroflexota bacterium]
MLFLVISTPLPTRPSEVREQRKGFWPWVEDKLERGIARSFYPRTGRGAVVVFDVDSHEMLHGLLNEWADAIPAEFGIYPLMEPESIKAFLNEAS